MPRIRRASETDEGGRGLQLVTALSRRWGTRYTATGKCIWTEQPLFGPEGPTGLPTDVLGLPLLDTEEFARDLDALTSGDQELPGPAPQ
jgi:hypothetical protein